MKKLNIKKIESIQHLRRKGHGYKAIAKILHLSPATVHKYSNKTTISEDAKFKINERQHKRQQFFAKKYAKKRKVVLSEDLAEFIGALLGDGCLSRYFSNSEGIYRHEVAFTGSNTDFPYYANFLKPTLKNSFGLNGRLFVRKDRSTRFHIRSKKAYLFFANLGIQSGIKTEDLRLPDEIIRKNNLSIAAIRGVYNTDGCIYLPIKSKSPNTRITLKMNAKALLEQIKAILERNKIITGNLLKASGKAYVLDINRKESVYNFLKLIGFSNEHHLNRMKSFGIRVPF